MARIIYGSLVTDIKGSIGGITFQKNGSGQIARLKPRKNQTNTQKQRDQQPRLKQIQREWNLLTLANKLLWIDFASANKKIGLDGQNKTLTGYQWFLSINQNRLLFDDPILSVPPVYEIVNPATSVNFLWNFISLNLQVLPTTDNINFHYIGYCSFIVNSVSKFDFNKTRLISKQIVSKGFVLLNWVDGGFPLWSDYYDTAFPPNLGNKSFYLVGSVRIISKVSGISSLAYTAISKFVWDGSRYVIE